MLLLLLFHSVTRVGPFIIFIFIFVCVSCLATVCLPTGNSLPLPSPLTTVREPPHPIHTTVPTTTQQVTVTLPATGRRPQQEGNELLGGSQSLYDCYRMLVFLWPCWPRWPRRRTCEQHLLTYIRDYPYVNHSSCCSWILCTEFQLFSIQSSTNRYTLCSAFGDTLYSLLRYTLRLVFGEGWPKLLIIFKVGKHQSIGENEN